MRFLEIYKKYQAPTIINNISWSLGAESISKIVRVFTLFALAWALPLEEYGTVMLALILQDMVRLLMRCGAGAQVIQCVEEELPSTLFNGVILQWCLCVLLVCFQIVLGWAAAAFYQQDDLFTILLFSAPTLLFFPIVCSRVFTITRSNMLSIISTNTAISLSLENLMVAICGFLGAGIFSVVIGKYVFVITWTILFLRKKRPLVEGEFDLDKITTMLKASCKLAGSEMARALRIHIDLLVAGKLMTPELVGTYSIARNASIGISQSFVAAIDSALFPYFCKLNRKNIPYRAYKPMSIILALLVVLVITQAFLAPYYMPILFAGKSLPAINAALWLCFAILPCAASDFLCSSLRAGAHYTYELVLRYVSVVTATVFLVLLPTENLEDFAINTLAAHFIGASTILIFVFFYRKTQLNTFYNGDLL